MSKLCRIGSSLLVLLPWVAAVGCKRDLNDGPTPTSSTTAAVTTTASAAPTTSGGTPTAPEGTLAPLNLGGSGAQTGAPVVRPPASNAATTAADAAAPVATQVPTQVPTGLPIPSGFTLPTALPGLSAVPSNLVPPPWQPPPNR